MSQMFEPYDAAGKRDMYPAWPSGKHWWLAYLVVLVPFAILVGLLVMGVANARNAARQAQFKNNLKQIGLAAHNFHGIWGHFPPMSADGSESPDVTQPISFHTASVPFVEAGPTYSEIDKTTPWNAPANREPYEHYFSVFASPFYDHTETSEGYGVAFSVPNTRLMSEGVGIKKEDITDGISNTILAGGIDDTAVPAWGDPENGRDPSNGFAGGAKALGGLPKGGAQVLFADGRVRIMSAETGSKIAKALATPAGGEIVEDY